MADPIDLKTDVLRATLRGMGSVVVAFMLLLPFPSMIVRFEVRINCLPKNGVASVPVLRW